ncbi:MAG: ATP-binding protein [Bacteroidota bacterium]
MANHRDAQVTVIMGRNGTGKSTFLHNILKKIGGKTLVVTMAGLPKIWRQYEVIDPTNPEAWEWKKGIKQLHAAYYEEETFKYIFKYFRGGAIVFDDCKDYIPERVSQIPWLKRLLINYRHKEVDLYFVAHSPSDVPKQVWQYSYDTFVGATSALFNKSQVPLGHADEIIKAQHAVNAEFRKRKAKNNASHYGLFVRVIP